MRLNDITSIIGNNVKVFATTDVVPAIINNDSLSGSLIVSAEHGEDNLMPYIVLSNGKVVRLDGGTYQYLKGMTSKYEDTFEKISNYYHTIENTANHSLDLFNRTNVYLDDITGKVNKIEEKTNKFYRDVDKTISQLNSKIDDTNVNITTVSNSILEQTRDYVNAAVSRHMYDPNTGESLYDQIADLKVAYDGILSYVYDSYSYSLGFINLTANKLSQGINDLSNSYGTKLELTYNKILAYVNNNYLHTGFKFEPGKLTIGEIDGLEDALKNIKSKNDELNSHASYYDSDTFTFYTWDPDTKQWVGKKIDIWSDTSYVGKDDDWHYRDEKGNWHIINISVLKSTQTSYIGEDGNLHVWDRTVNNGEGGWIIKYLSTKNKIVVNLSDAGSAMMYGIDKDDTTNIGKYEIEQTTKTDDEDNIVNVEHDLSKNIKTYSLWDNTSLSIDINALVYIVIDNGNNDTISKIDIDTLNNKISKGDFPYLSGYQYALKFETPHGDVTDKVMHDHSTEGLYTFKINKKWSKGANNESTNYWDWIKVSLTRTYISGNDTKTDIVDSFTTNLNIKTDTMMSIDTLNQRIGFVAGQIHNGSQLWITQDEIGGVIENSEYINNINRKADSSRILIADKYSQAHSYTEQTYNKLFGYVTDETGNLKSQIEVTKDSIKTAVTDLTNGYNSAIEQSANAIKTYVGNNYRKNGVKITSDEITIGTTDFNLQQYIDGDNQVSKPPIIANNGNWWVWESTWPTVYSYDKYGNPIYGHYVDTSTKAQGPKGDTGATGPKGDTGPQGSAGNNAENILVSFDIAYAIADITKNGKIDDTTGSDNYYRFTWQVAGKIYKVVNGVAIPYKENDLKIYVTFISTKNTSTITFNSEDGSFSSVKPQETNKGEYNPDTDYFITFKIEKQVTVGDNNPVGSPIYIHNIPITVTANAMIDVNSKLGKITADTQGFDFKSKYITEADFNNSINNLQSSIGKTVTDEDGNHVNGIDWNSVKQIAQTYSTHQEAFKDMISLHAKMTTTFTTNDESPTYTYIVSNIGNLTAKSDNISAMVVTNIQQYNNLTNDYTSLKNNLRKTGIDINNTDEGTINAYANHFNFWKSQFASGNDSNNANWESKKIGWITEDDGLVINKGKFNGTVIAQDFIAGNMKDDKTVGSGSHICINGSRIEFYNDTVNEYIYRQLGNKTNEISKINQWPAAYFFTQATGFNLAIWVNTEYKMIDVKNLTTFNQNGSFDAKYFTYSFTENNNNYKEAYFLDPRNINEKDSVEYRIRFDKPNLMFKPLHDVVASSSVTWEDDDQLDEDTHYYKYVKTFTSSQYGFAATNISISGDMNTIITKFGPYRFEAVETGNRSIGVEAGGLSQNGTTSSQLLAEDGLPMYSSTTHFDGNCHLNTFNFYTNNEIIIPIQVEQFMVYTYKRNVGMTPLTDSTGKHKYVYVTNYSLTSYKRYSRAVSGHIGGTIYCDTREFKIPYEFSMTLILGHYSTQTNTRKILQLHKISSNNLYIADKQHTVVDNNLTQIENYIATLSTTIGKYLNNYMAIISYYCSSTDVIVEDMVKKYLSTDKLTFGFSKF